ncbi:MAG: methionyl-tRNA formyltransferase [Candidatus Gracilibacteria bacterium]|nr:methionyl-tRNA formyltransferase [Candidatus Gracilibacteria bacterium]
MKIAFFGTGDFSKNILKGILEKSDIEVKLVVSQPDKPVGRKHILEPTQVKVLAQENNIKVLQPEILKNNTEFFDVLNKLELDFIVVVAYGKIVPKEVLESPKYGCINIHGSILPMYRGASPIQEAIKNGDKETGLTIMYMSKGMDEGDILAIEKVIVDKLDTTEDIFKKFELIGPDLLIHTLKGILDGTIEGKKQNDDMATFCRKISKEDGQIDFESESGECIFNKFRAYSVWPGIYSYFKDKKFDIEDCELIDFEGSEKAGKVLKLNKKQIGVVCNNKKLLLFKQVKLEGKKSMDILSFANGNKDFLEYNF